MCLQAGNGRRRRIPFPHLVDEVIERDHLASAKQERPEYAALLRATERKRTIRDPGLQRPEHAELEMLHSCRSAQLIRSDVP